MKITLFLFLFILLSTRFCDARIYPCFNVGPVAVRVDDNPVTRHLGAVFISGLFWEKPWSYSINGMTVGLLISLLITYKAKRHSHTKLDITLNTLLETQKSLLETLESLKQVKNLLEDVASEKLPESASQKLNYVLRYINNVMNYYLNGTIPGGMKEHTRPENRVAVVELSTSDPHSGTDGHPETAYSRAESDVGRADSIEVHETRAVILDDEYVCFMNKMDKYLEEHLSEEKYTVSRLSRDMGMCRTKLSDKLKEFVGETPSEYMLAFKMEKAKKLLATHQYKIGEIATMLGYCDSKYFGIVFKKYANIPPSVYAEKLVLKGVAKGRRDVLVPVSTKTEPKVFFL